MTTAETLAPSISADPVDHAWSTLAAGKALGRWLTVLVLAGWIGLLFFDGLTSGPLFHTEGLRALVADEMLRSGNWIVPQCYHEPLLTKPPGAYIAIALCSMPFGGVQDWTARLPSAFAASATTLLFFWYFSRRAGKTAGIVAAVFLPMSFLWLEKVPTAEIDALQVMWISASLLFLFRALEYGRSNDPLTPPVPTSDGGELLRVTPPAPPSEGGDLFRVLRGEQFWWLAALLCVAGGFLTKWTAPAFFYFTAIPLLWWRGRLRLLWGRCHLVAASVAVLLCLGWVMAVIGQVGWSALWDTVYREGMMRVSPAHHDRSYPWLEVLTHPFRLWGAALPCSLVALFACRRSFAQRLDEPSRRLLEEMHCWIWPNLLFWTIIPEHATRHSYPLFPGITGLAILVGCAWLEGRLRWPFRRFPARSALATSLCIWLVVKLVFSHGVVPPRNEARNPRGKGDELALLVPPEQTLYLFRGQDDGLESIVFYYDKAREGDRQAIPVQRLADPEKLPSSGEPVYCIVDESDWDSWDQTGRASKIHRFTDEREVGVLLVRLSAVGQRRPAKAESQRPIADSRRPIAE
jgi:4-amino-4-deoxy-L-arabinose transferase-like glycosyltransferase